MTLKQCISKTIRQLSNLDLRPVARRTDPETSHEAAASITPKVLRDSQIAVLQALVAYGPITDEQLLLHLTGISPSGARTRRKELTSMGYVRDTGRREKLVSGRMAIVWEAKGDQ